MRTGRSDAKPAALTALIAPPASEKNSDGLCPLIWQYQTSSSLRSDSILLFNLEVCQADRIVRLVEPESRQI
jgi:hypothetical protein